MIKSLADVLDNKQLFTELYMQRRGKEGDADWTSTDWRLFDQVHMRSVRVIPDKIALRFFEQHFVLGTHFIPDGLPGAGMTVGDVYTDDSISDVFLTTSETSFLSNNVAMHLVRDHEKDMIWWCEHVNEVAERIKAFHADVKKADAEFFGVGDFEKMDTDWHLSYVGWSHLGTPTTEFLDCLDKLAIELTKNGVFDDLRNQALALIEDLEPYRRLEDLMNRVRAEAHHKRYPWPVDGLLTTFSPPSSGGASWYSGGPSDDLRSAVSCSNGLTLLACQVGNIPMAHVGRGQLEGVHYRFTLPRAGMFDEAQELINSSNEIRDAWEACRAREDLVQAVYDWMTEVTWDIKRQVVKQRLPSLLEQRPMGFYVDLVSQHRDLLFSPVISQSLYEQNKELIEREGLTVTEERWDNIMLDVGRGLASVPSVFDDAEALA